MATTKPLSGYLKELGDEIFTYATDYGLDFYPVVFEVCDYDTICILASQNGFPVKYPHWRNGMQYDQLSKGNTYGFQKIYELVINTDPCYAYLLSSNRVIDQKLVMAHVYGHADFFKNNCWFKPTDKKMMDVMANHSTKIRRYMEKYGIDQVESFIDLCLSFEDLLDVDHLFETPELVRKRQEQLNTAIKEASSDEDDDRSTALKAFMRSKLRASNDLSSSKMANEEAIRIKQMETASRGNKDIMKFLMDYAPIQTWQADILGLLRDEAYYFLPQRMTKIMNEGWASYWHSTIMTQKALNASEIIDFADVHSGVMAMSKKNINPYKVGLELFRDIEHRWDTGKFGKEYNECTDMNKKENWDTKAMLGRKKIFEVRSTHNDTTFIDEFLTPDFCERQQLFTYKLNPRTGRNEIDKRDFVEIKNNLLKSLTNFGTPLIEVENANYNNRSELFLRHVHRGVDLDLSMASDTLRNIYTLWKRPVLIATTFEDKEMIYIFDGKEMKPYEK